VGKSIRGSGKVGKEGGFYNNNNSKHFFRTWRGMTPSYLLRGRKTKGGRGRTYESKRGELIRIRVNLLIKERLLTSEKN